MKLNRASALGVFAGIHLARQGKKAPIQGKEIAESLGTPHDYLLKVLQQLVKARIFMSERGPAGGFQLRKDPDQITLLDIVEAIEGPIDGDSNVLHEIQAQPNAKHSLESAYNDVARFARSLLKKTTIKDLAA